MAPKKAAPRRRAKRSFNVSAIEAGTALSLAQSTGFANALQTALNGNLAGAVNDMSNQIMTNKQKIIGTIGAAAVARLATKGFGALQVAKLGPIRVKL